MPNLWEDLETGPNPPEAIYAVVECLKGERNKYEYDCVDLFRRVRTRLQVFPEVRHSSPDCDCAGESTFVIGRSTVAVGGSNPIGHWI